MTKEQASKIHRGDIVLYQGQRCTVNSVKVSGIAAPFFRLSAESTGEGVEGGQLISYQLCSLP